MTLVYRSEKGAPLTVEDLDGNFKELNSRLKNLEALQDSPETLQHIEEDGDRILFKSSVGEELASIVLPKASLNPCGKWIREKAYQKGDLVFYKTTLALCAQPHTSMIWEEEEAFWNILFSTPPSFNALPLYDRATLPAEERLGALALLADEEACMLLVYDGRTWLNFGKGKNI